MHRFGLSSWLVALLRPISVLAAARHEDTPALRFSNSWLAPEEALEKHVGKDAERSRGGGDLTKAGRLRDSPVDIYGEWRMGRKKSDQLQGTLDLLVLQTLEEGPMHGWGITLHIERVSDAFLRVEEGSLYPALHRMEQEGWIRAEWGTSENNRRARFYRLTTAGRKQLEAEREHWRRITRAVDRVLDFGRATA